MIRLSKSAVSFVIPRANVEGAQRSPKFPPGPDEPYQWTLKYVPKSPKHDTCCSICVQMASPLVSEPKVLAHCEMIAADSKGVTIVQQSLKGRFGQGASSWGWTCFAERKTLLERVKSDDQLNIRCKITVYVELVNGSPPGAVKGNQPCHSQGSLSTDLQSLVDDQKFGDVTIQIGSRRFLAYKGILSARSPVFASMFEHQMQENIGNSVSISDIKPDVFKELLHYIYTDQLTGLDAVIPDLYAAADKYAISSLKDRCRQHILQKLSWKTGAETLMLADTHQDPEMKKQVLQFFSGSVAGKVTESAGWRKMARTHPYLVDETVKALAAKVRVCEQ